MEQSLFNNNSEFITVNRSSLDKLVSLVEELVINKVRIEEMKNEIKDNSYIKILDQEIGVTSQVQDAVKKMLMVKMKNVYSTLRELVKTYSKENNIDVELIFEGEDTEVENSSIGTLTEIFKYFIVNMFENDFKTENKKSFQIKLKTISDNKTVSLSIENNGKGFDNEYICKIMNKQEIETTSFSESEIYKLISIIDEKNDATEMINLSNNIASLGGSIILNGEKNKSKQVKANVPVSSSIIQALLVKISEQIYAIPLEAIETIINRNAVKIRNANNNKIIIYRDHPIKLISVSEVLNIKSNSSESCIVIVKANGKNVALLIDYLLDQTDIVIKPKPAVIKDIKEYKGTTILGDGLVTLVLDVASLSKDI